MSSTQATPERTRRGGLLALLLLAACSTPTPPPPPAFNPTDTAWLQLMIPMNEQALPALDLAPPELAGFAAAVKESHQRELVHLRRLRAEAGLPDTNLHAGHQMPGLVTEADLAALRLSPSGLAGELREHLDQSALVARGELDAGANQAVKDLAAAVSSARTAQLAELSRLESA
ncbi:DUF305 domain-containing protein [Saccharothrix coeruleofusca]|uniref:DUF305 domain-containing protein n=1 Tax=Saccharothrix coeruleofusca TaxID=33919 RepID=A0A918EG80_9PSEU|nr:DUF305 domain-containing protein [Saccharothrix coeruleofusca]GGP71302.1 DUF305 domain-containing protein [Saccharothrix coeruleofusca]